MANDYKKCYAATFREGKFKVKTDVKTKSGTLTFLGIGKQTKKGVDVIRVLAFLKNKLVRDVSFESVATEERRKVAFQKTMRETVEMYNNKRKLFGR